jgi:PPM family protein phosphatase
LALKATVMHIKGKAYCHKGLIRNTNEDHLLLMKEIFNEGEIDFHVKAGEPAVFAVADGLGGHNAGEVASRMVLENLDQWFNDVTHPLAFDDFAENLALWAEKINESLKNEGQEQSNLRGMGTTLAGVYLVNGRIYTFTAGDSRIYVFKDGGLKRLSTDHTVNGKSGSSRMHILTNCFGASISTFIDTADISEFAASGSKIMVCSDGLTDMVRDAELEDCLLKGKYDCMLQKALQNGGKDNISYIIIEMN